MDVEQSGSQVFFICQKTIIISTIKISSYGNLTNFIFSPILYHTI